MPKNNSSRYARGSTLITHKGNSTVTTVGSPGYSNFKTFINATSNNSIGYVPAGYEHRPDLISNLFYGTPNLWWLILETNNIEDPFESLNVGDRILFPKE